MTHRSIELERLGVHPRRVGVRRWRRARGLTIRSMADMLGITSNALQRWETGLPKPRETDLTRTIFSFMERWEKVPDVQERIAQENHRQHMRYAAVAFARRKIARLQDDELRTERNQECVSDPEARAKPVPRVAAR